MEREAQLEIADMAGLEALPRRSGDLVFHDEWERRVFALGVSLCERGEFEWNDFRRHLAASIAATGETSETPDPEAPGYYEHWLAALESVLAAKGLIASSDDSAV